VDKIALKTIPLLEKQIGMMFLAANQKLASKG